MDNEMCLRFPKIVQKSLLIDSSVCDQNNAALTSVNIRALYRNLYMLLRSVIVFSQLKISLIRL